MNIPCILMITDTPLLGQAFTSLVNASDNGLYVMKSGARVVNELIVEMNTCHAEIILVEKSNFFAGEEALTKLLMLFPRLLVIIVNEENNWLNIYRREDILMTSPADLIGAIQSA